MGEPIQKPSDDEPTESPWAKTRKPIPPPPLDDSAKESAMWAQIEDVFGIRELREQQLAEEKARQREEALYVLRVRQVEALENIAVSLAEINVHVRESQE